MKKKSIVICCVIALIICVIFTGATGSAGQLETKNQAENYFLTSLKHVAILFLSMPNLSSEDCDMYKGLISSNLHHPDYRLGLGLIIFCFMAVVVVLFKTFIP